jgi:hypothetical protein
MIGLSTPGHETTEHLPETDVHVFLDEDDAVEVVWHQLTSDNLDLSAALSTCAERLLCCPLFVKRGDIIPAAQNGSTQLRGADMCLCGSITA